MKYRSKPFVVEAVQWHLDDAHPGVEVDGCGAFVTTIHNQCAYLADGDYILPGPQEGRFYPCKPAVFEAKYEAAE